MISALWQLIGMAVFGGEIVLGTGEYGWCYGLGWASFLYPLVAGIIQLLGDCY